jgi:hypothetical protein
MRNLQSDFVRGAAIGMLCAAAIAVVAIPILVWGREGAPEFFGAFAAAIVAAIAVVTGAYYQASLTRQRDEEIRRQEQYAQAVDLCFWLDHAVSELEFIADTLAGISRHLEKEGASSLEWTQQRYREVVSAEFMNELPARAKSASRLPLPMAEPVAKALYKTFMRVERLHWRRGIPDGQIVTAIHIAEHEKVVRTEGERLRSAQQILSEFSRTAP